MKKVLILSSSPRRGGNSDTLCDQFAAGAGQAGHDVEKILLREHKVNYCTGCGVCYNGVKPCPQKDDAASIVAKMVAADVIVLATPVYFYTMCGQLKTLIDRCCARYLEMKGKEFCFILTAADTNVGAMKRTVEEFRGFLACLDNPREREAIYGVGAWEVGEINSKPTMQQAYTAGQTI